MESETSNYSPRKSCLTKPNQASERSKISASSEENQSIGKDALENGFVDMDTFDKVALDRTKWRKLVAAQ
jgi:hypothetical protein